MVLPIKPVVQQAVSEANWYALATITASAYVQMVPENADRRKGVWVYNQNTVSTTSSAFIFKNAAPPTSDAVDALLLRPSAATVAESVVFIPGTGPIWAKSQAAGILASLKAVEW